MSEELNVSGIRDWKPLQVLRMLKEVKSLNLQSLFDLPDLWAVIKEVDFTDLWSLMDLPDLDDKAAVREWLATLAAGGGQLAAFTPTEIDDKAAALLTAMVESDDVYDRLFDIADFSNSGDDYKPVVGAIDGDTALVVGIDPVTIFAIIGAVREVISLIKSWRQRRQARGGA
ncbi:MAG: hypothetical protein GY841_02820 [FCB group bacterium]|nr:hypothetical protein [FCB group bacterium]